MGVSQPGEQVGVREPLGPVDPLLRVRRHPRAVDHDRGQICQRRQSFRDGGIGRGVALDGECADGLLDAIATHDDRPRRQDAPIGALARRLDPLLCGKLDGVVWCGDRCLERRQLVRRIAARSGHREPARLGDPQERGGAVSAGRPAADLEELVERGIGVTAAGYRSDGREEQGVGRQGVPIVHRQDDPSIEHPIEAESQTAGHILPPVRLVLAIIHNEDAGALVDGLLEKDYRATRLHSSGGFLKQSNATIVLGVEDDRVDDVLAIIAEHCTARTQVVNPMPPIMEPGEFFMPYPLEVEVGGATVFVVPVERFERL